MRKIKIHTPGYIRERYAERFQLPIPIQEIKQEPDSDEEADDDLQPSRDMVESVIGMLEKQEICTASSKASTGSRQDEVDSNADSYQMAEAEVFSRDLGRERGQKPVGGSAHKKEERPSLPQSMGWR
jgi:hypothetical protein